MMNSTPLHPNPRWERVLVEQFRAVGFGIRRVVIITGLGIILFTGILALYTVRVEDAIGVEPEMVYLVILTAPLLPIAVWKGEYNFRHSYLASMPVGRSQHVLAKIAAGWAWLLIVTSAFLLWMLLLALVTGGAIGADEMRIFESDLPTGTPAEEAPAYARRWRTLPWQWATFFTGPMVTYLFGSAIVLAGSTVRRWLAGFAVLLYFFALAHGEPLGEELLLKVLLGWVERIVTVVVWWPFGLMDLLAATDAYGLTTAAGVEIPVYRDPATLGEWVGATFLWTALAVLAVLLVIRHGRKQ